MALKHYMFSNEKHVATMIADKQTMNNAMVNLLMMMNKLISDYVRT